MKRLILGSAILAAFAASTTFAEAADVVTVSSIQELLVDCRMLKADLERLSCYDELVDSVVDESLFPSLPAHEPTKSDKPPKLVKKFAAKYPEEASEQQLGGLVTITALVGKTGRIVEFGEIKGPEIFRQAAINAAKQFVFEPAEHEGKKVRVWVSLPFRFNP